MEAVWYSDENVVVLVDDDGRWIARGSLEVFSPGLAGMHYTVSEGHRGQGHCSKLIDYMMEKAKSLKVAALFCDDPSYDGMGTFSEAGQRVADAYRTNRGIPLPDTTFVRYERKARA